MKYEIKAEYIDWIARAIEGKKVVAFTVNFRSRHQGEHLTEKQAIATVRRYYNGLCRKAYGPWASANKDPAKLQFAVVTEGKISRNDHTATQFHFHGVIEVPKGMRVSQWEEICVSHWVSLGWADPKSYDFKRYRDEGWLEYMLKSRTKEDVETSLVLELLNLRSFRDA